MEQKDELLQVVCEENCQPAEKAKTDIDGINQLDDILLQLGRPGLFHAICFFFLYSGIAYVSLQNGVMTATINVTPTNYHCKPSLKYFPNKTLKDIDLLKCHVTLKGNSSRQQPCESWTYIGVEDGEMESIVTQWDLVCDRKFYPQLSNTIYFVGVMCGAATLSHLSDIYGRRRLLLTFGIITVLLSVVTALLRHFTMFMIARFLLGVSMSGLQTNCSVMLSEMVPKAYNNFVAMGSATTFLISVAIGAALQCFLKNWWQAQLIIALPMLFPLAVAYFFLPESFRWLIVHKQYDELSRYLKRAASMNKTKLSTTTILTCDDAEPCDNKKTDLNKHKIPWIVCLKYKEMRRRTLSLFFIWNAIALTYYTLSLNLKNIAADPYKAYAIASAVDVIPLLFSALLWNRFGKRRLLYCYSFFGGLLCVVYKFYNHIVIMIIGKSFSGITVGIIYFYTIDLFPTSARNFSMGACITVSRLGSLLAPQVVLLGIYTTPDLPVIISGVFCLVSSILIFFLPETTGVSLPDTIDDVENYGLMKKSKKLLKNMDNENNE